MEWISCKLYRYPAVERTGDWTITVNNIAQHYEKRQKNTKSKQNVQIIIVDHPNENAPNNGEKRNSYERRGKKWNIDHQSSTQRKSQTKEEPQIMIIRRMKFRIQSSAHTKKKWNEYYISQNDTANQFTYSELNEIVCVLLSFFFLLSFVFLQMKLNPMVQQFCKKMCLLFWLRQFFPVFHLMVQHKYIVKCKMYAVANVSFCFSVPFFGKHFGFLFVWKTRFPNTVQDLSCPELQPK